MGQVLSARADVAQSAEQLFCKQPVIGSSPIVGSPSVQTKHRNNGRVPEWTKGSDCKSDGFRLRWFESAPAHWSSSIDYAPT